MPRFISEDQIEQALETVAAAERRARGEKVFHSLLR